jgi:hypothetical protein
MVSTHAPCSMRSALRSLLSACLRARGQRARGRAPDEDRVGVDERVELLADGRERARRAGERGGLDPREARIVFTGGASARAGRRARAHITATPTSGRTSAS